MRKIFFIKRSVKKMKNDCKLSIFIDIMMVCNFLISLYTGRVALFTCINAIMVVLYNNSVMNTLSYYCSINTNELEKRNAYKEIKLIRLEIIFNVISIMVFIIISIVDIYRAINIHKMIFILFISMDYIMILISSVYLYNKFNEVGKYIKKLRCFK